MAYTIREGYKIVDTGKDSKEGNVTFLECLKCNRVIKVNNYNIERGFYNCNHNERRQAEYYIGKDIISFTILGIVGKDAQVEH